MGYTISKLKQKLTIVNDSGTTELNGYAFMDKYNHCAVIVYGEKQRYLMSKYLKIKLS
jgi:hypothetical protein